MLRKPLALLLTIAMALSLAVTVSAAPPAEHENLALRCNPVDLTLTAPADGKTKPTGTLYVQLEDADTFEVLEDWDAYGISTFSVKTDGPFSCEAQVENHQVKLTFDARDTPKELGPMDQPVTVDIVPLDSSGKKVDSVDGWGCNVHVCWYDAAPNPGNLTLVNCDGRGDVEYLPLSKDGVSLEGYGEDVADAEITLAAPDATSWSAYDVDSMYKQKTCDTVHHFLGWSLKPDASAVAYQPGELFDASSFADLDTAAPVLYAVYSDVLAGDDLPGNTQLPFREGYDFDGFYGPDGTKLVLKEGTPVLNWATYYARWKESPARGQIQFEPITWWETQAVDGYTDPLTTTVIMSVTDSKTKGPILYTVSGFEVDAYGDAQTGMTEEQVKAALTCTWDGGVITLSIAPGLPVGQYRWIVMPIATASGVEIDEYEFEVKFTVQPRLPDLVYYNVNCDDAIYDPPAPTEMFKPLTDWTSERKTADCTLDANGGVIHSIKEPDKSAPTLQASVQWTFAGWNTKADGTGTAYQPGGTYNGPGAEILYAQWSGPTAYLFEEYPVGSEGNFWVSREGYAFEGWFSEKTGGIQLTETTTIPVDSVWYAHWKLTDPSVLTPAVEKPSMSDGEVQVKVTCNVEGALVWCAVYDENGQMLGVKQQPAVVGENVEYVFSFGEDASAADQAKVFLLTADGDPLCESGGD